MSALPVVHVVYENPDWNPPIVAALKAEGFPYRLVHLDDALLDPAAEPPEGIWWNRVSPSSHTRAHHHTVAVARELLHWLERAGRTVINGSAPFELEMSKFRQELALRRQDIRSPRTVLAVGRDRLLEAAATFDGPFITKHNQGGKGLGILRFDDLDSFAAYLDGPDFDPGPDGKLILQEYIAAPEPFITRVEIAWGRLVYAMRSNTSQGFELCPSDACQVTAAPEVCPADGPTSKFSPSPLTESDPLVQQYIALCRAEGLTLAGIEFVEDAEGNRYTYDINGTTNYSGVLGEQIGVDGMREVVRGLKAALTRSVAAK